MAEKEMTVRTITETIARAMRGADARFGGMGMVDDAAPIPAYYTSLAQSTITALTEAGYAIVPREPDVDLLMAMAEHYDFAGWPAAYRAMVAAFTPPFQVDSEKGK